MNLDPEPTPFRGRLSPAGRVLLEELNQYCPPRFPGRLPFTAAANRRREDANFIDHLFDADLDHNPDSTTDAQLRHEDPDWQAYSYRTDHRPAWVTDAAVAASYDNDRLADVLAQIQLLRSFNDELGPVLRDDERRRIDTFYRRRQRTDDFLWPVLRPLMHASLIAGVSVLAWNLLARFTLVPGNTYILGWLWMFFAITVTICFPFYVVIHMRRKEHRAWYFNRDRRREVFTDDNDDVPDQPATA